MAVGFKVQHTWFQVGSGDFLHAFFSTICYNLEDKKWGKKYPLIMTELYSGKLEAEHIEGAMSELSAISARLQAYPPTSVIWDIDDLNRKPPWGQAISKDITNLCHYFVTSDGTNLLDVLKNALDTAKQYNSDLQIYSI